MPEMIALKPKPHRRFTVKASVVSGVPAPIEIVVKHTCLGVQYE